MIEVDSTVERRNGVTLVTVTVTNPHRTAQRVRIRSRLSGPTWSPQEGPASTAWSEDEWERIVEAGRERGLGFASLAEPVDQPIEVVDVQRADDADSRTVPVESLPDWAPTGDVALEER